MHEEGDTLWHFVMSFVKYRESHYVAVLDIYYMALSHKVWEVPNSRIWLAETDIDRGLDFPI